MMTSLQQWVGQELKWVHPHIFQQVYELRAGEECLARLSRSRALRRVTLAESAGQQWRFKKEGHWKSRLVIYPGGNEALPESGPPVAEMRRKMNGSGELTFSDGRVYTWSFTRTGFLKRTWHITGPEGTVLSMRKSRLLEIAPEAQALPEMPLLVLFSLYIVLIKEEEEAAARAAG